MFKGFAGSAKDKNTHAISDLPSQQRIELFDSYTGDSVALYRNFPLPITLSAKNSSTTTPSKATPAIVKKKTCFWLPSEMALARRPTTSTSTACQAFRFLKSSPR